MLGDRGWLRRLRSPSRQPRRHAVGGIAGAAREARRSTSGAWGGRFPGRRRSAPTSTSTSTYRSTEAQQRDGGVEYNYRRPRPVQSAKPEAEAEGPAALAAVTGTDVAGYARQRPGMSAFVVEDGVVYHTYSTYSRGVDALWGMYQWLDRAPKGRNETGVWWRRHDEYAQGVSGACHGVRAGIPAGISPRINAAPCHLDEQRCANDRLVHFDVGDGWHADARGLDDVDDVDADARPDVAGRRGVIPWHVARDDGGDDAAGTGARCWCATNVAVATTAQTRLDLLTSYCWRRLLLRLDRLWPGCVSAGHRAGRDRDASTGSGARCAGRRREWPCWSSARSNSPSGRRVTSPAAAANMGTALHSWLAPERPGDTASAWALIASSAVAA